MVDHFSRAGTSAITDFTGTRTSSRAAIRSLIKDAGGAFFEELTGDRDRRRMIWTPEFADAFEAQLGHSPIPYLPLIVKQDEKTIFTLRPGHQRPRPPPTSTSSSPTSTTTTAKPLKAWANALGPLRPALRPADGRDAGERLSTSKAHARLQELDDYRRQAGARDMAGNTILSNEAGATAGGARHHVDQTLRKLALDVRGGRQPERLPRLQLPDRARRALARLRRVQPVQRGVRLRRVGARASRPGSTPT